MATALEERAAALERLRSETFDLMVVGAGIIGARVALEAALTGARVALVEARDFGG
ncbi:MAG: glycerol-3-phosphate dehydrogenase/oxidase, partial [Candidatus Dormibacteraeota bacterium]|nr:glycerol-3-phosphate dehydrogenase/oxidase [Candidatus Dormibacteraeota bacterium]